MYVFFDLEASNSHFSGSVCQIGILVADEKTLEVLETRNVLIDPRSAFNLHKLPPRGNRKPIQISVTKADVRGKPTFEQYYAELARLYFNPDNILIGHSVLNDIHMLEAACRRYNLPMFRCKFFCTQVLYSLCAGHFSQVSLERVAEDYGITFEAHDAVEDTIATFEVFRALVRRHNLAGTPVDGYLDIQLGTAGPEGVKPVTSQALRLGTVRENINLDSKSAKRALLAEFLLPLRPAQGGPLSPRTLVCLAEELEFADINRARCIAKAVFDASGRYTMSAADCHLFVRGDDENDIRYQTVLQFNRNAEETMERDRARGRLTRRRTIPVVTLDTLLETIRPYMQPLTFDNDMQILTDRRLAEKEERERMRQQAGF